MGACFTFNEDALTTLDDNQSTRFTLNYSDTNERERVSWMLDISERIWLSAISSLLQLQLLLLRKRIRFFSLSRFVLHFFTAFSFAVADSMLLCSVASYHVHCLARVRVHRCPWFGSMVRKKPERYTSATSLPAIENASDGWLTRVNDDEFRDSLGRRPDDSRFAEDFLPVK